ncbi:MAG: hypothetical protein SVY53_08700 [Chloroflexota bacterium]|nr:hypothetical protein [Chloroflexota bacterium]
MGNLARLCLHQRHREGYAALELAQSTLKTVIPVQTGIQGALAPVSDVDSLSPIKSVTSFTGRTILRILTKPGAYEVVPTNLWDINRTRQNYGHTLYLLLAI